MLKSNDINTDRNYEGDNRNWRGDDQNSRGDDRNYMGIIGMGAAMSGTARGIIGIGGGLTDP
jgi:hypothetical protein